MRVRSMASGGVLLIALALGELDFGFDYIGVGLLRRRPLIYG